MTLLARIVFIFLVASPIQTFAARAPDIVEKTFVIKGDDAEAIAAVLGINSSSNNTLKLSWNIEDSKRNCTWDQVATSKLQRCEDLPILVNTIKYLPSELEIQLTGHWLDESTGSGQRFAKFSFYSQKFNIGQELSSDWNSILIGAISKIPLTMQDRFKQARIQIGSETPFFEIKILELRNGQRKLALSLDYDSIEAHKQKVLANEEWQKKYGQLD